MTHAPSLTSALSTAAEELDRTLNTLATYLLETHLHSLGKERAPAPHCPPLRTSFALLPEGAAQTDDHILELHVPDALKAAALAASTPPTQGSADLFEVAVGVRPKALAAVLAERVLAAHRSVGTSATLTEGFPVDRPLGLSAKNAKACGEGKVSPQAVILTPSLLAQKDEAGEEWFPSSVVNLMLAIMPAHEALWTSRRRAVLAAAGDAAPCNGKRTFDLLHTYFKELLWVGILLTGYHKLQPLFVYRAWVMRLLLTHVMSLSMLGASTSLSAGAGCVTSHEGLERLVTCLQEYDWASCFAFAAEQHPLNYNGWHYRRLVLRAVPFPCRGAYLRREFDITVNFLLHNNSDSSAAAYLLFLLAQADALAMTLAEEATTCEATAVTAQEVADGVAGRGPWEMGGLRGRYARGTHSPKEPPSHAQLLVNFSSADVRQLWVTAFHLTQRQLRVHAEKGHECFFFLRLGLVSFALEHNASKARAMHGVQRARNTQAFLLSGWQVADELEWIAVFTDGYADNHVSGLLTPTPPVASAFAQCSGGIGFTAYLAARYGQQLIALLKQKQA